MSNGMKLLIGLILFFGLGWAAIYSGWGNQWPGGGGAAALEGKLAPSAQSAVDAAGFSGISVKMDGQKAILSGSVRSDDARHKAEAAALSSTDKGGLIMGGVTRVDASAIKVVKPVENPWWSATVQDDGSLVLDGYVHSEDQREALLAEAERLFPDKVIDKMQIAPDAFDGALPGMQALLGRLPKLQNASAGLKEGAFWLKGTAATRADGLAAAKGMDALASGFGGAADIDMPAPQENQFGVAVDEGQKIADSAKCQSLFSEALSKNTILFAFGKADIRDSSHPFLDFLAELSGQCDAFKLDIAGYTDNVGSREVNMSLSGARANAVRNYLIGKGVSATSLSARGMGPDNPVCTENTRECRARNRRIEITVEK